MGDVDEIDDSLYSRQRYVLGDQAMKRMANSNVFLSGMNGLGIEIAKNVVLAGIRQLTIHDCEKCSTNDLGSQFYLSSDTLGQNRAEVSLAKLKELNPYVTIQQSTQGTLESEDLSFLDAFQCCVLVSSPLPVQLRINEYCHQNNISFISCDVRGIVTWAFVDNGDEFIITDPNGENPSDIMIADISSSNPAVISCLEHRFHDLETNNVVQFSDVKGCSELNGNQYKVTVIDPHSFSIDVDTTSMAKFERGNAMAVQVKVPETVKFLSLKESLLSPQIIDCDFGKFGMPQQLFLGMEAFYQFQEQNGGQAPRPWDKKDADVFLGLAERINKARGDDTRLEEIDERILTAFAYTAAGELQCFSAFMGGIIGQEVIKSLSGKFTPLQQWMFLDASEVLPCDVTSTNIDLSAFQPQQDRYDALRICVGNETISRLASTKLFMVGAGAIGCEMMKNFAMLGVGRGDGCIHLTDNDLIEKSNLNRQFLFRTKDIQSPKSTTAANAAISMNPDLKVNPSLDKVGKQTEEKFSNQFLGALDLCVNALDNVEARMYMDQRIVATQRPLLESGTLGPKGHVQVVVPYLSESYASQSDPQSKDIPFCTLKSFPNSTEHCTIWARDLVFEENLATKPRDLRLFLETKDLKEKLAEQDPELYRCLPNVAFLLRNRPKEFRDCVAFARAFFEDNFKNSILQLLRKFPLDHEMNDGTLFWAAPRRAPTPLEFDGNDPLHYSFVYNFALLWSQVWNVQGDVPSKEEILGMCNSVTLPEFVPKEDAEIETDENAEKPKGKEETVDPSDMVQLEKEILGILDKLSLVVSPVEFEKDDDTNHHIDVITAATNLRARCYTIKEANRLEIKRIAGNITPAIATTTSAVAGLVALELIKLRMNREMNLEHFKNAFISLAISLYALSEPGPVEKTQISEKLSVSMWDRWEVSGGKTFTLQQFLDRLKKKYGLNPMGVVQGSSMIFMPMPMYKKKLDLPLISLLKETEPKKYDVVVTFTDKQGNNVEGVPVVRFSLARKKKTESDKKTKKSHQDKKKRSTKKETTQEPEKRKKRKKSSPKEPKKKQKTK